MSNPSKAKGTRFESAVTNYLRMSGFPFADRQPLRGKLDCGDIRLDPCLIAECKAGAAAHDASYRQVSAWLGETERERVNANADLALLILDRKGRHVGMSDVYLMLPDLIEDFVAVPSLGVPPAVPVRFTLADAVQMLRAAGYGEGL